LKIKNTDETLKNIETNILTKLVIDEENNVTENYRFLDINLKYLLTVAKYPDIDELKKAVLSCPKKSLPILRSFINWEKKYDINKLLYIEKINNFINAFSEENKNLISRQKIEEDHIEKYLISNEHSEQDNSSLKDKFKEFCEAYDEITIVSPYIMSMSQPVKTILNDQYQKTPIYLLYCHLIKTQNDFLQKVISEFKSNNNNNEDILIKNAIEQIQKKIIIQNATKADIFEFNVKNNIILSFEELFSFYSNKDIFNKSNNEINYSNYSNIKFKLSKIEKELINIILTGKKLFSDEQITYKFYLDPYKIEEKTIKFKKFTDLYDREDLTDDEKNEIASGIDSLKRIILPNLEILINYLLKQNNYQSKQSISEIKLHSNLYLNQDFIHFFSIYKYITINKLVSLYEFLEEQLWESVSDRYVNQCFHCTGNLEKIKSQINKFIKEENTRELKNDMLISLLIKYICRYLPYESNDMGNKDLFQTIQEKNAYLPENIKKELDGLSKSWGILIENAIDFTKRIVSMIKSDRNKIVQKLNESVISDSSLILTEGSEDNEVDEEGAEDSNEGRDF
jgi:hypothetical protein